MNNGFKKAICMIVAAVTMFACAACGAGASACDREQSCQQNG